MGSWTELTLRKEQFDLIIECLKSRCCECSDFLEIERYVYLIEELQDQDEKYQRKLYQNSELKSGD